MPISYAEIRGKLAQHRKDEEEKARREAWIQNLRQPWRLLRLPIATPDPEPVNTTEELPGEGADEEEENNPTPRRTRRPLSTPLSPQQKIRTLSKLFIKTGVWFSLWCFFIHIGFGAIFFIVSIIYLLYRNLGEGDRGPSAYSVFNENCEQLQGTFTAEEFDKGMRTGYGLF